MTRLMINIPRNELEALDCFAKYTNKDARTMAVDIIRKELVKCGFLSNNTPSVGDNAGAISPTAQLADDAKH